jgi:hypothetical protein
MLDLKNVTLLSVDIVNPERTWQAMLHSMRFVKFGDIILATDTKKFPNLGWMNRYGIRLHHIEETDDKEYGPVRAYFKDYERHSLLLPYELMTTDFLLFQEWDSCVLNPLAWDYSLLRCDYVGAVWPQSYEPGWPPVMEGFTVGNGGFSLRSRKFCELILKATYDWHDDPSLMSYDCWMCRTMRPWLEANGVRFATEEQALRFSCEDSVYTGQFGFHGKNTVAINGWKLPWF